jgi:hypothetical protein
MAFAGLSEGFKWPDATVTRTFTIITTYANGVVGELHGRMLVILEPSDWPMWLAEVEGVEGDPAALLRPASDDVRRSGRAFSGLGIVPKRRIVRPPRVENFVGSTGSSRIAWWKQATASLARPVYQTPASCPDIPLGLFRASYIRRW